MAVASIIVIYPFWFEPYLVIRRLNGSDPEPQTGTFSDNLRLREVIKAIMFTKPEGGGVPFLVATR